MPTIHINNTDKDRALIELHHLSLKPHRITYAIAGSGHGDPGGWSYIDDKGTCNCVIHTMFEVTGIDESKPCNCGAMKHNNRVKACIKAIKRS